MSTPLVSVCIRAYRDAEHLEAAIASVLRQTFDDFEVVVSDDSGRLRHVVERFDDPRLRYSANPSPAGPAANLRRAMGLSEGSMVAFLNEDDAWLEGFLATAVAKLEADPTLGAAFTNVLWEVGGHRVRNDLPFSSGTYAWFLPQILEHGIPCSATLLRRSVWDEGERTLPIEDGMVGDSVTWLRAAESGWGFHFVDEPLAVLRVHRDQVSWGDTYWERAVATLQAFRFDDVRSEQLRRARLAESLMANARVHLSHGLFGQARSAIAQACRIDPRRLGVRDLLALSGVREMVIRRACAHPRALIHGLSLWRRLRPSVLS